MNYNIFDEIDYFTNFKGNNNMNDDDNNFTKSNDKQMMNGNNLNYFLEYGNQGLDLYPPYDGYIRGNLFKNLYQAYKNFKPARVRVSGERDEMMLNIGQMAFASHELNLYLDNYPNDREALNLFTRYRKMTNELIKDYERRYGPLTVSGDWNSNIPFKWESDKWPWEM